jgi:sec-independent protein translocase protein TatB
MFDIGFWELIFILVITLLVVGPERLPRVARTAGLWLGKVRGFIVTVKADIDQELAAEELKRTLAKQAAVPELEEIIEDVSNDLHPVESTPETRRKEPDQAVAAPAEPRTGKADDSQP